MNKLVRFITLCLLIGSLNQIIKSETQEHPEWKTLPDGTIDPATVFPWPDRPGYSLDMFEQELRARFEETGKLKIPPIKTTTEIPHYVFLVSLKIIAQNPNTIAPSPEQHLWIILHEIGHSQEPPRTLESIIEPHFKNRYKKLQEKFNTINTQKYTLYNTLMDELKKNSDNPEVITHADFDQVRKDPKCAKLATEESRLLNQRDAIYNEQVRVLKNAQESFIATLPADIQQQIKENPLLANRVGEYWADAFATQYLNTEELDKAKEYHSQNSPPQAIEQVIQLVSDISEDQKQQLFQRLLSLYHPTKEQEAFDPEHPAYSQRYAAMQKTLDELRTNIEEPQPTKPQTWSAQIVKTFQEKSANARAAYPAQQAQTQSAAKI